jgi:hypothetical protein
MFICIGWYKKIYVNYCVANIEILNHGMECKMVVKLEDRQMAKTKKSCSRKVVISFKMLPIMAGSRLKEMTNFTGVSCHCTSSFLWVCSPYQDLTSTLHLQRSLCVVLLSSGKCYVIVPHEVFPYVPVFPYRLTSIQVHFHYFLWYMTCPTVLSQLRT